MWFALRMGGCDGYSSAPVVEGCDPDGHNRDADVPAELNSDAELRIAP